MQSLPSDLWPFLKHTLRPWRWRIGFVIFAPVFMAFENNALPYALKLFVDKVSDPATDPATIWEFAWKPIALYVGVLVAMLIILRIREYIMIELQPKVQATIRETLFTHVHQHSQRFFADNFAGAVAAKINDLARAVNVMKDFLCWRAVTSVCINLIAIILITRVHWGYGLLVGGWVLLHLALARVLGKRIGEAAHQNAEDRAQLSGTIVDSVSNAIVVRLFARRRHEADVMRTAQANEITSQRTMLRRTMYARLIMDIPMCVMYLLLFSGLVLGWQKGIVTTGDMVYVLFATFLVLEQTWMLAVDFPGFVSELGSARNALRLIATPIEITDRPDAKPLEVSQGAIAYRNVTFRYRKTTPLFSDLSVAIKPGEKVGLVGYSGSGKSSFVNLLLRLYDIQEGAITIDGQNVGTVTQESLHKSIALIPQDTSLFHRSLRDNIAYGNTQATEEQIRHAATLADCERFIDALPQGYDTLVGERGIKLSGGQRQRIALARAILKDAPILVLDEATSALDSVTEAAIQRALSELMRGKTVIVIAHRLATLSQMDRILVFDAGRIIEEGTHAGLLAKNGHYARMWHMQAGGFLPEKDNGLENLSPN